MRLMADVAVQLPCPTRSVPQESTDLDVGAEGPGGGAGAGCSRAGITGLELRDAADGSRRR